MLAQHINAVSLVVGLASVAGGVAVGLWLNRKVKAHALPEIQHTVMGILLLAAGAMLGSKGLERLTIALNNGTEVMRGCRSRRKAPVIQLAMIVPPIFERPDFGGMGHLN